MQGGSGSISILDYLRTVDGIDAQPLSSPNKAMIETCQVVVLPQPRGSLGDIFVSWLEDFVRDGGGLITTHDSVGYRRQPLLITDVCAKGVSHIRHTPWVVTTKHPVTQGIEMHKPLHQDYYDHIELAPGPNGIVLAIDEKSRLPVVVVGEFGKGRYVACGLILGLTYPENKEIVPTGAERILLENAVKWCGGRQQTIKSRKNIRERISVE